MKINLPLMALIFSLFGSVGYCDVDAEPPIGKDSMISIRAWDPITQTFEITKSKYEGQGPNYATIPDLLIAIKTLDKHKVKQSPKSIVGNVYKLDSDLRLQSVVKIEAKRRRGTGK